MLLPSFAVRCSVLALSWLQVMSWMTLARSHLSSFFVRLTSLAIGADRCRPAADSRLASVEVKNSP